MYFSLIQFTLPSIYARLILIPFWDSLAHLWASLTHFSLLSILGSFHSYILMGFCKIFRASPAQLPYPLLFHLLIHFFGLLRPIFACFPFLIIFMGLLLPSLGSLGLVCFLLGSFLLFYKPVDHYSCHLGLMVFSYFTNSSFFTLCYIVGLFIAICPFLFSQNGHQQH